jgi:hypothetical protein
VAAIRQQREEALLAGYVGLLADGLKLSVQAPSAIRQLRWHRFTQAAAWHRLGPIVHYLHAQGNVLPKPPAWASEWLAQQQQQAVTRSLVIRGHLRQTLAALNQRGIVPIVLKGAPLASRLYPVPYLRVSRDIDILVRPDELPAALQTVRAVGFMPTAGPDLALAYENYHHHLVPHAHAQTGCMIELHRALVRPDRPYRLDTEVMRARAIPVSIEGQRAMLLSPEDELIYLCVHFLSDRLTPLPGALLQVCDLALFLKREYERLDWTAMAAIVKQQSLEFPVYAALDVVRNITGIGAPEAFRQAIRPVDFDDIHSVLFVNDRVIHSGKGAPERLVQAVNAKGARAKLRAMFDVKPPERWTPGGVTPDLLQAKKRSVLGTALWYGGALGRLIAATARLPAVFRQVKIDRWLIAETGEPHSTPSHDAAPASAASNAPGGSAMASSRADATGMKGP